MAQQTVLKTRTCRQIKLVQGRTVYTAAQGSGDREEVVTAMKSVHGKTAMTMAEETLVMIGAATVDDMRRTDIVTETLVTGTVVGGQTTTDNERGITSDGIMTIEDDTRLTAIENAVGGTTLVGGGTIEVGRGSGRRTIRVTRNGDASLRIEFCVGEICMCVYHILCLL